MTTKRYARTVLEAFGPDARESYPIERWTRSNGPADVLLAVTIGLALAWGLYHWMAS